MLARMAGTITTILWDVGGTLMDWATPCDDSLPCACQACGIDPALLHPATVAQARREYELDEPTWRTAADERAGWRRHAAALLRGSPASDADVARLGDQLDRYFEGYAPIAGIADLLADLSARGFKQAVVSNWPPSLTVALNHHDLSRHFTAVICSADHEILKPDARLFHMALTALNARPEDAVFIGNDPLLDIAPAKALGMRAIHFDPRRQHATRDASDVEALRRVLRALDDS